MAGAGVSSSVEADQAASNGVAATGGSGRDLSAELGRCAAGVRSGGTGTADVAVRHPEHGGIGGVAESTALVGGPEVKAAFQAAHLRPGPASRIHTQLIAAGTGALEFSPQLRGK